MLASGVSARPGSRWGRAPEYDAGVEVLQLVWWPENVAKLEGHGIAPVEVEEIINRDSYAADVHPDYLDQVRITGYTAAGRWLTIALEDLGEGVFRPVTGWVATEHEVRRFFEEA